MDELLAQLEAAMDSRSEEESFETITIDKHTRRRRHPGRNVIPDTVETEEVVHDVSEEEKQCDCCGNKKVEINRKEHTVVTRIPAKYKKIVHIRHFSGGTGSTPDPEGTCGCFPAVIRYCIEIPVSPAPVSHSTADLP